MTQQNFIIGYRISEYIWYEYSGCDIYLNRQDAENSFKELSKNPDEGTEYYLDEIKIWK